MLLAGCMNGDHARRSIQWDVYLAIAAAFGVSNAMQETGVAKEFAQLFISIGG
jgi:di/tricarboxylate transporter